MKLLKWEHVVETINDLLGYKEIKIFQNTQMFNFSLDSVLLPNFVTLKKETKKIMDIGCGNAPIPLILTTKIDAQIIGVEIQKDVSELAIKSIDYNNLNDKISIINADINEIYKQLPTESFDTITCNPPFFKINELTKQNESEYKKIARHEIKLNLEQLCEIARYLLKTNGNIAIVHRPERLIDIISTMLKYNIQPKIIRFVYPKVGKDANCILIEGTKNGLSGVKILKPLYVHNEDGSYSEEVLKYFK